MKQFWVAAMSLAVVVGCQKSEQPALRQTVSGGSVAQSGKERDLFPLKKGNQWVYVVESGNTTQEMTMRVTSVSEKDGVVTATITSTGSSGKEVASQWQVKKDGVFQVSTGPKAAFDPPQLVLPFPAKEGQERPVTTTGPVSTGGIAKQTGTIRILGSQEADTAMGRMSGVVAVTKTKWGEYSSESMTWWSPGVGFVRQTQSVSGPKGNMSVVVKLKSYSFP